MKIDFAQLSPEESYRWLSATITPRPIAWVSTCSSKGISNLAPFSFFQIICDKPATLMVNIALQTDGRLKDTLRNIQETGELVIHLVPSSQAELMNASSATLDPDLSEFEHAHIPSVPSLLVTPPRVRDAPVSYECRLAQIIPYPPENPRWYTTYAEALIVHIDDRILDDQGRVDPLKLDVIGRLAGNSFCHTRELLEMVRPA